MYRQLNIEGKPITAGALTLTGIFEGEMEPIDRVSAEGIPGVWTNSGAVIFEYNGREYSQAFSAYWFYEETFDFSDDDNEVMCWNAEADNGRGAFYPATAEEMAAVEKAAGGAWNLYQAQLDAMHAATAAARADALEFLDQCLSEGEA